MHPFLDYILKANLLLIFFGLFYLIFLKRETFYQLNRWYFIGSIIVSITAPFVTFTKTVFVEPIPVEYFVNDNETVFVNEVVKEQSFLESIDLQQISVYLILFISSVLIIRKIYAVAKLYRSIKKLPSLGASNIKITADNKTVYSFYQWIVVPENFFQWQNHKIILDHESIHLNQKHTFDLILIELVAAVFWFNPLVKVMQRAINTNLEFIVDQKMIETTESVLYQKNLLQFQTQHAIQFVNSYNASEIKNRILQLNSKKSTNMKKLKFLLATPALVAFFALFQIETVAQIKETIEVQEMDETSFLVRENFTKDDFAKLSKRLKDDFDIDFSVRNIKYENNKIKSLDYTIRNKDLKISTSETATDKIIDPFLIIVNLNGDEPFRVEKYSAKPTYAYTVDNEVEPNFVITDDEWKDDSWVNKISKNQRVIYVIDGKKSSKGAALTLNPKDILSINVHRDQETKDKFKEDVDNVVIIKTKKVKDVTNRDKDLELLLSDRKAFDRIAAKYPIYVDGVLLKKKQLKKFDTKTIRSMYVDENTTEIKLETRKSETETFFFKIEDDNDRNDYSEKQNKKREPLRLKTSVYDYATGTVIRPFSPSQYSTVEESYTIYQNGETPNTKRTVYKDASGKILKVEDSDDVQLASNTNRFVTSNIVYVVDGDIVMEDNFRKIDPKDIESITILKDQKSKEKYAAINKEGVMIITTKAKKEVSLQRKTQSLKGRELAMKKRNEIVAERKDIILQNRKEREKSGQQLLKKRNEISEKAQQHRKELEEQREKLLAKRKETIVVSNKKSDKKLLNDYYKTLNDIFKNVNKTFKEIEDENFKITSVKASITREDGTKVELSEVY